MGTNETEGSTPPPAQVATSAAGVAEVASHAQACGETADALAAHHERMVRLLNLIEGAAQEAARRGRSMELVQLTRAAIKAQDASARCLAGRLSLIAEEMLAKAQEAQAGGDGARFLVVTATKRAVPVPLVEVLEPTGARAWGAADERV